MTRRAQQKDDYTTDPRFERKAVSVVGVKILDEAQGIVEAVVSGIGNIDDGGDIVQPSFFQSSLDKHLRKLPKGVWSHDWDAPIAKTLETYTLPPGDPRLPQGLKELGAGGQYVKGQFNLRTSRGRDAFADVVFFSESGEQEWSIGYVAIETEVNENGNRLLKEGAWYEWSPVLFGMNPLTATIGVKGLAQVAGVNYEQACKHLRSLLDQGDETKRAVVLGAIRDMAEAKDAEGSDEPEEKAAPATRPQLKQFAGSLEERMMTIRDAIDAWVKENSPGGEVVDEEWGGYMAYGYAVATFESSVIVCVVDLTLEGDERRKHFDFPYSVDENEVATLGVPTEVVLEVVVSPKRLEMLGLVEQREARLAGKSTAFLLQGKAEEEDLLQLIHDNAVELGAYCAGEEEKAPAPPAAAPAPPVAPVPPEPAAGDEPAPEAEEAEGVVLELGEFEMMELSVLRESLS